ncbi:succinylglutamate desuccinylase/aspartoacylase family protein [Agarivorans aestuarii]|uniref:Succinylglutamate desuccinylase/aspartoacylase family protein n=1 Tax=Agarivorans aestuarii TaxID=1563703 RepID=A0ABU7G8P9_9ALTE|nr:succinylglutamate desuccinylase/aspartoacylase family protein [Agarivorans aestuarii]MEE1675683.1 succinylglutamate desuccinylase/aspartoacylase family protein [Agarivorans aestuarii]
MSRSLILVLLWFCFSVSATEQADQYEEAPSPKRSDIEETTTEISEQPAEVSSNVNEPNAEADSVEAEEAASASQPQAEPALPDQPKPIIPIVAGNTDQASASQATEEPPQEEVWGPLSLLNTELSPNSSATLDWYSGHLPGGFEVATPVIAIHGSEPGPRVCITAAIHGDELNGVEIARRVVKELSPENLKGTVISVPVVNIDGLWRQDRYMSDRRDLNRAFPGSPNSSTASRVAYSLFNSIILHCDSLVDLHSGSMFRENLTQLRADLTIPEVADVAKQFGAISVLQSIAPSGSLRGAATAAGIPAVVMEVGGPYTVDEKQVETGVKAVQSYLSSVNMLPRSFFWSSPQPVFYASQWLRARDGGILLNKVDLGTRVNKGQLLGTISNPITDDEEQVLAPFNAVVLGRAQNQVVSAGFAIYNLGERRSIEDLEQQGEQIKKQVAAQTVEQLGLSETKDEETNSEQATSDADLAQPNQVEQQTPSTEETSGKSVEQAPATSNETQPNSQAQDETQAPNTEAPAQQELIELIPEERMPQPEDEDG